MLLENFEASEVPTVGMEVEIESTNSVESHSVEERSNTVTPGGDSEGEKHLTIKTSVTTEAGR